MRDQLQPKLIEQALKHATRGRYVDAARTFEQSTASAADVDEGGAELAYALYRLALLYLAERDFPSAIQRIETAKRFPNLPRQLNSLFQERIDVIQREPDQEVREFDKAIAGRFESGPSHVVLRDEFLKRYTLEQAKREANVTAIEGVSAVGVYRWAGDSNRNDKLSQLIRNLKRGEQGMPALFGRILADHVQATNTCMEWIQELDYMVPIPAADRRTAERGADIVLLMGKHLSYRLKIPLRAEFLKRSENPERSRDVVKATLATQYSFNSTKERDVEGRVVLLLDDVMTRGHTAEICATLLKEHGCAKVFLLVLARAESTLQSDRYSQ